MDDKIKNKIAKLLRLAESSNKNEAESAMAKAVSLMNKHNLSESDLYDDTIILCQKETRWSVIPNWVISLYSGVSKSAGVYFCYMNMRNSTLHKAFMFLNGRQSDVDNVEYIAEFLINRINSMSKDFTKSLPKELSGMQKQAKAKSYRMGLVDGITENMLKMTNDFFSSIDSSKSLIPIEDNITRMEQAKDAFLQKHTVKESRSTAKYNSNDFDAGKKDASNINIHKGVSGNFEQTKMLA